MENRFRFRAWNSTRGTMAYFGLFDETNEETFAKDFNRNSKKTVMQSASSKDKNDKLIYEGDIVELPCFTRIKGKYKLIAEVVWQQETASFSVKANDTFLCLDYWIDKKENTLEIIGNIYEHKHLLEKP